MPGAELPRLAGGIIDAITLTRTGVTSPGLPHYVRVSAPMFNTQATHVPTVWHSRAHARWRGGHR